MPLVPEHHPLVDNRLIWKTLLPNIHTGFRGLSGFDLAIHTFHQGHFSMIMGTRSERGLTLLEALIVIAVIGVLAAIGIPSFIENIRDKRVRGAAENLAAALQNAKAEAVKTNQVISIVFNPATTNTAHSDWCYGMTIVGNSTCDCTGTNTPVCATGSITDGTDYPNVTLTFNATDKRSFDPLRGEANGTQGTVTFNGGDGKTLGVRVSTLGRITICRPSGTKINGYKDSGACP